MTKEERKDTNGQEYHFNSVQVALMMESERCPLLSGQCFFFCSARRHLSQLLGSIGNEFPRNDRLYFDAVQAAGVNHPQGAGGSHTQVRFTARPPDQYGTLKKKN